MNKSTKNQFKESVSFLFIYIAIKILPSGNLKKKLCFFLSDELFVPEKEFLHLYSLDDYRTINRLIKNETNEAIKKDSYFYFNKLESLSEKTLFNIKNTVYQLHKK